jgi:hypothetical protein
MEGRVPGHPSYRLWELLVSNAEMAETPALLRLLRKIQGWLMAVILEITEIQALEDIAKEAQV